MSTTFAGHPQPKAASADSGRLGEHLVHAGLLSVQDLDRALRLQRETKEPLGRILIAQGSVRRYDLYKALSSLWGLPFVDLVKEKPDPGLARLFPLELMIREQFVPLSCGPGRTEVAVTCKPDDTLARMIAHRLGNGTRFRVTTEWDIEQALRRLFKQELLNGAIYGLYFRNPEDSAYTVLTRWQFLGMAVALFGALTGLYFFPRATLMVFALLLNVAFAASIWFKFVVSLGGAATEGWEPVTAEDVAALRPHELPHYTILVPVYKETRMMPVLMDNLARLDYPPEKLEIQVLLEEDDRETIAAAKAAQPSGNFKFVIIPNRPPKTKPKACNAGLHFARGKYLVIYDAEDRPEPDQLKKAVVAFRKGPPDLICVQAALNYYNPRENFLTRMFTLEYSYWFDYMLPGLDRFGLPIPLGGTSNHFRTDRLRELCGWDPFNVTEDADLGVRAAARGYRVGVVNSTTFEEANTRVGNWIRQRSRWLKGYMQTTLVYLRHPFRLVRRLGLGRTLAFLLLVGGTPLTLLAMPFMWGLYVVWLLTGTHAFDFLYPQATLYISLFNLLFGNALAIYLGMLAVFKRRCYDLIGWSLLTPVYWLLHSIACAKALGQLFTQPFFWEKTTHGISKLLEPGPSAPASAPGPVDPVRAVPDRGPLRHG